MWNPLAFLKRRRRSDADFADEIAAHLALEADRLIAEGYTPDDALYEARRRFGNVGIAKERFHRRRTIGAIENIPRQIRRAARRLVKAPVFSITAALTLMLGIGATTAVFSLVNEVLLRPLPFAQPEQLVELSHTLAIQGVTTVDQSDATYLHYRRSNRVFTGVGAYQVAAVNLSATGAGDATRAERIEAARVSASIFPVLAIAPLHGRVFRDEEDLPNGAAVVILGERLWRNRYGADRHIIGRAVLIDGVTREVIGIMPERFAFPDEPTALWLPIGIDPTRTESATFDIRAVARLRAGVSLTKAQDDVQRLLLEVPQAFPGRLTAAAIDMTDMRAVARTLQETVIGGVGRTLWVVLGAAAFLLLVAAANVANLFLVRAEQKQHDLVVRRALGASRGAVVAEFVWEGLLLAVLGTMLGLALADVGLAVLRSMESGIAIPRLAGVGIDGRVLGVALGITVLVTLVMTVVPALRSYGSNAAAVLMQSGRGATAGRSRHRARRIFAVVQVALALVLITGAGLMARSFQFLRSVPPGFDATQAQTMRVALAEAAYPATSDAIGFVTRALDGLTALPGVAAAGVISKLPLDDEARRDTAVWIEDRPLTNGEMPNVHQVIYASPGAFGALGIPLIQGQAFERPDPFRAPLEVIVTRALATRYWGEGQAVGKRLRLSVPRGAWFTVVGVTGDVHGTRLDQPPDETVYLPLVTAPGPASATGGAGQARWSPREWAFVVRSTANSRDVVAPAERVLRTLAPTLPVYGLRAMAAVVDRSTARTSFTLRLLGIASIAALVIGAVGLYGVVAYMVSLRTREMAVRMAVGARPATLRRQVMTQAVTVAAFGIVLGLAAAALLMRFLTALLFNVAPTDAVTLLCAAGVMVAVAILASWWPARRVGRIDLSSTLRLDN